MKQTLRLTLELELHSAATVALAGRPDTDLSQLREVLEAYCGVVDATVWPATEQGEFQEFVTQDVEEFSTAIYAEASASRWNVAVALIRPVQERSEYALAAAIDPAFVATYRRRMGRQIEAGFKGRARLLVEEGREESSTAGPSRRTAPSNGTDGLLKISKDLNRIGSEVLHHGIGLSRVSADNDELLRGLVTMAHGRAQLAVANVLLAIEIVGAADTAAWRTTRQAL